MVHWHVNLSCVAHCFFPAKCVFSAFLQKKFLKSDFQAHCYSNVYQSSKMLYVSARNLGMRFKLSFYHSTQCRRDADFHVFGKKNAKKDQYKISLETYFRIAENAVVLCKNLDTEGKILFVVAHAESLATSEGSDLWSVVLCSHILRPRISDWLLWDFWRCCLEHPESKHISGHVLFFRTVDHGRVASVYYPTHSLNIPGQKNTWKPCASKYLKCVWIPYEIPTVFPWERSISRDKIVTDRVRVSECHGVT